MSKLEYTLIIIAYFKIASINLEKHENKCKMITVLIIIKGVKPCH